MDSSINLSLALRQYIHAGWDFLRRSPLDPAPDPKVLEGKTSLLYIPTGEDRTQIEQKIQQRRNELAQHGFKPGQDIAVEVRYLPTDTPIADNEHGMLYLPHDFIVPGGRFNEMYGWDSYWIVKGLLKDGLLNLARGMVENCFYQIENYGGKILNANRTYYLSRSHPPLLGAMIRDLMATMPATEARAFLERATPIMEKECRFWKTHRYVASTGLFRYGHPDMGALGPCPEVSTGEVDPVTGLSHYDKIVYNLRQRDPSDPHRQRFYDAATDSLTAEAIASDRGMRESGFDPSMYMGFYGLETLDLNPVCLNTLLYMQFNRLADFYQELEQPEKGVVWRKEASHLAKQIQELMWNETDGFYYCYNHSTNQQSSFKFLTSFYPLFARIASPAQAERVRSHLNFFETEHGLKSTLEQTGCQWDAPHMWAPLVDFAVQGLMNYGFADDAYRIGGKFLRTAQRVYDDEGGIYEKYNAQTGSNRMTEVTVGYKLNVVGFGWTNAVIQHIADLLETLEKGRNSATSGTESNPDKAASITADHPLVSAE